MIEGINSPEPLTAKSAGQLYASDRDGLRQSEELPLMNYC